MTKSLIRTDGILTISTTKRGRTNFHWWLSNHDLLGIPDIVRHLFRSDLCDLLSGRPGVIYIQPHGGAVTGIHSSDAPAVEASIRRWLRRWVSYPGAGRFARGYAEIAMPKAPAAGAPGELSVIERMVDKLLAHDELLQFIVQDLDDGRNGERLRRIAEPYGFAGDELIHRFCPAGEDPMTKISQPIKGALAQVLGNNAPRLPAVPEQGLADRTGTVTAGSTRGDGVDVQH